jgi:Domain of unknown function (DUF1833)
MPRSSVSLSFRRQAEASFAGDVDLCFLTISHPLILEPIRVVWDTKDYIYGGYTFVGFPFDITLLSDDENPPKAQLNIQNVDSRIGDTIRQLRTPPRLRIELLSSSDFNLNADPRTAIASTTAVYVASNLFLTNVKVDVMMVSGEIQGWDYLQRVWPGVRAREDIFPGLFR